MKKLFAVLLSALLLCGIMTPAFAEDAEPDKPELVAAEIVSIPEKNKVVYTGGAPEAPDGIVVKLTFSNGSEIEGKIIKTIENEKEVYSVLGYEVHMPDVSVAINRYGEIETYIYFCNHPDSPKIKAYYTYYSEQTNKPDDASCKKIIDVINTIILFFKKILLSFLKTFSINTNILRRK